MFEAKLDKKNFCLLNTLVEKAEFTSNISLSLDINLTYLTLKTCFKIYSFTYFFSLKRLIAYELFYIFALKLPGTVRNLFSGLTVLSSFLLSFFLSFTLSLSQREREKILFLFSFLCNQQLSSIHSLFNK